MNHYSIYGSCLRTEESFPELRPARDAAPKWDFSTTPQLEPMQTAVELGADRIYGSVYARLYRHAGGHRIIVDDTGEFDLAVGGRRLRWQRRDDAWPDFVRAHLMGRVLATSLFLDGWLPLHGSGVAFRDGAIGFLAPKGYGKSSLALALTRNGARLVTDDTLPVELSAPPRAWPGVHSMRVHPEASESMGLGARSSLTREGKVIIDDLPADQLQYAAAPLRALYLLYPVETRAADHLPERTRVSDSISVLSIIAHVKIARMLGSSAAPVLLDAAARIVGSVPVYSLTVPRDLSRLSAAAAHIAGWHTGEGAQADGAP